jgi:Putative Tad-like Flp pilus-assembly
LTERLRSESGQVIPFVGIVLLAMLLGMCALAIDAGVWFKASRDAQNVADAAAIAAVQDLPANPAAAQADATAYASQNDGTLDGDPSITTTASTDDTVSVRATKTAPAIFARIFGIDSETVHATASAQVSGICRVNGHGISPDGTGQPLPVVVSKGTVLSTPLNQATTLYYGSADPVAGGQFGLIDFANSGGGTSPGTVGDWVTNGYNGTIACGSIQGITGNKFNSPQVNDPMSARAASGKVFLLPVYDGTNGSSGGQMAYNIVGWAAFRPTSFAASGSTTTLQGSFVRLLTAPRGQVGQFFGVGQIKLTK